MTESAPAPRSVEVLATGPLVTLQDLGRPGLAALGVGQSGAADPDAFRLANRLLGNPEGAPAVELTFGGLELRARGGMFVALTGAPCPITVCPESGSGRQAAAYSAVWVPDGATLRVGTPTSGLRSYLAVRGGFDVEPVLGSCSTDLLAGLGPDVLDSGQRIPVGAPPCGTPPVDPVPMPSHPDGDLVLRVVQGPRADWFSPEALEALLSAPYEVTAESNRVGMRLSGPALERSRDDELPSEGMVRGALQVPPSGQPTLFLADHPVTGGYPVIAVVVAADIARAAQARPGQCLRFTIASAGRAGRAATEGRSAGRAGRAATEGRSAGRAGRAATDVETEEC